MFDDVAMDARAAKLMGVVDALNQQHGMDTVQLGGRRHPSQMGHARGQSHAKEHGQLG